MFLAAPHARVSSPFCLKCSIYACTNTKLYMYIQVIPPSATLNFDVELIEFK